MRNASGKSRAVGLFSAALIALATAPAAAAGVQELKPGAVFRDCDECPEMVVIPAGIYIMGFRPREPREEPAHRVNIKRPFAIGRFEVTFDEWEACRRERGCRADPSDHGWGKGRRPVINVTFDDALQYVAWIGKKTGKTYRLPSEAEWEYADRAGTTTEFWLGDDVGVNRANCKDCGSQWSAKGTAPAGSFEPNPFGLHDTVGNVFEWLQDCWNESHRGAPSDASPRLEGDCTQRVMRGGSFYYFKKVSRASYRSKNNAEVKSYWLGFRLARELP